jgi:hypothetical protein
MILAVSDCYGHLFQFPIALNLVQILTSNTFGRAELNWNWSVYESVIALYLG